MWISIRKFLMQPRTVLWVYILVAIVASLHLYLLSAHVEGAPPYTDYNNYVIFKRSFFHLLEERNLYMHFYPEQWDLYKYSPSFALAMAPLAYVPDVIALPIWNLLNALALLAAIRMLPFPSRSKTLILWFILLELLTSMQNTQSNGLMAALMIATYNSLQRGRLARAALWVVIAAFIKVYAVIVFALFLFYPGKIKFIGWSALWTILIAAMPLIVIAPKMLLWQYHNWGVMMGEDQSTSYGLSVMGWLHSWFGINGGKMVVTLAGIALFFVPFLRVKMYKNEVYRLLMLSFMLLWVIIFNHKAESATFIVVMAAVSIWYYTQPRGKIHMAIMALVFVFTCLTPTDLFTHDFRTNFLMPYVIKGVPAIFMWVLVLIETLRLKPTAQLPTLAPTEA